MLNSGLCIGVRFPTLKLLAAYLAVL